MEPRVVASPDGAHLAVLREHRLSLFALDTGRRVGVAEVTGTEVAFAGGHIIVHARDARASLITVLSLPALAITSSHELTAPTRLMAAASSYALLDRGDQALMIHCGRAAAVTPLRPPAAFTHAVGLDGPQFVTFGTRGAELWDAASRRPEARLRLELPADTLAVGLTNRHALLWAATSQPCLHLARISDGRVSTLWLDATPTNVRSHPVAAWVVADVGGRALAINLAIGDVVPLEAGRSAIVAVAPRRDRDTGAVVVFLDGDALELRLLGGEARPLPRREGEEVADADEASPPAAAPERDASDPAIARPGDGVIAAKASSLRERLGQRPAANERVIPPAQVVQPASAASSSLHERIGGRSQMRSLGAALGGAPTGPSGGRAPAGPDADAAGGAGGDTLPADGPDAAVDTDVLAPLAAAVVVVPAEPPPPPTTRAVSPPAAAPVATPAAPRPRAAPVAPRTWRDELVAWARGGHGGPAPALPGSSVRALHDRLELSAAAWPMLCALYGRWLLGAGAHGVASARLAGLAAALPGGGWDEALGHGSLAARGIVEWRQGRAFLVEEVGDVLDERAAIDADP